MNELASQKINKKQIYYARSYRSLKGNRKQSILYLLLLVLPCLAALLRHYGDISAFVCRVAEGALGSMLPGVPLSLESGEFIPFLDRITYVVLPTTFPTTGFSIGNLAASLLLIILFMCSKKGRNTPPLIFLSIFLVVHTVNSAFFVFAADKFPYSAGEYSALYMEQQVGIWISFLVMSGLVTGILGSGRVFMRAATFACTMLYSFAFGLLRYILALYVVYRFSVLYIAAFFFALGPFFDFLYFVGIYGIFLDRMIEKQRGEMEEWKWS